ncbi:MAG: MarR family transcriptional regulator [Polyangiales bacterium]
MHLSREEEAASVLKSLRQLVHGLRATSHAVEDDVGLTGAQLFVLRELAGEPDVSIRRLSERTMTDPSSVSVVVARLTERGLVNRRRDPDDGRRSVLSVSKRGKAVLGRSPEPYQAKLFAALQALPRQRLRQLHLGLSALLDGSKQSHSTAPLFFEDLPPSRARRKPRG